MMDDELNAVNWKRIFGENIRRLRKAQGWTQEELGERANLHRKYVGLIERGEKSISLVNAKRIADVLGVGLDLCMEAGAVFDVRQDVEAKEY